MNMFSTWGERQKVQSVWFGERETVKGYEVEELKQWDRNTEQIR